jgi:hypothetical protein
MEFRQEFVRPSVAYVTNKEMPAAKKPFRFQRAAPGRSSGLGPTVTRESRLKGWQSASTFLMDRKGASAESCGTSSSGMETTASDPFDGCLEPCAVVRVSEERSHPQSIRFGPNVHTKMSSLRSADVARTAIPPADLRRYLRIRVFALRPHSPNKGPARSNTACRTDFITRQLPEQAALI